MGTASVPFLVVVIKGYLKKEGFIWGLQFEGTSHPGKEQMARVGHVTSTVRKKKANTIHAQLVFSFLTV